jgi:RNA binding exosome subunit
MGKAAYERGNRLISRQIEAEPRPKNADIRGHYENRIAALDGRIAEMEAALAAAGAARETAERDCAEAETRASAAARSAELWKGYAMRFMRQLKSADRARHKLSAIVRWGLSPERYAELSADYDRENGGNDGE